MALLNGVYEPMDLDINIGKDNDIFSSQLTLVQISERCRLTWHERDQWKMTPPSWPVSSVRIRKAVRRTELSLSLSSVYFWLTV